jgi:hypothetical protein
MLKSENTKNRSCKSSDNKLRGPRFTVISLIVICLYILFFETDYFSNFSVFLLRIGIITSVLALISKNYCKKRSIYRPFLLSFFVGLNFIATVPLLLPNFWPIVGTSSLGNSNNVIFFFAAFLALTYTAYELWNKENTSLLCKVYFLNPICLFIGLFCSVSFIFGQELAAWICLFYNFFSGLVLFKESIIDKSKLRFNFSLILIGVSVIIGIIIRFIAEISSKEVISSSFIVLFVIMIILNLFFGSIYKKTINRYENNKNRSESK